MSDTYLSISQAAARAGVAYGTLRTAVERGDLPALTDPEAIALLWRVPGTKPSALLAPAAVDLWMTQRDDRKETRRKEAAQRVRGARADEVVWISTSKRLRAVELQGDLPAWAAGDPPALLTTDEVFLFIGVRPSRCRKLMRAGVLPAIKNTERTLRPDLQGKAILLRLADARRLARKEGITHPDATRRERFANLEYHRLKRGATYRQHKFGWESPVDAEGRGPFNWVNPWDDPDDPWEATPLYRALRELYGACADEVGPEEVDAAIKYVLARRPVRLRFAAMDDAAA
jgi:hypothetical protein